LHALRGILADERGWPFEEAIERIMVDEWHLDVALGRPGRSIEVGELVAFLLSERAAYLTGALINIDGGTTF
jgi:NAD(P)-dependent dehydrogenase (short-subunit alcohol dehydrogenase family)